MRIKLFRNVLHLAMIKLPNKHPEKRHENSNTTHIAASKEVCITQRRTAAEKILKWFDISLLLSFTSLWLQVFVSNIGPSLICKLIEAPTRRQRKEGRTTLI